MKNSKIVKTSKNTRIPCICSIRTARIIYHNREIGTISEEVNDAGEYDWVIRPNYDNLNKDWIEISGIDLDLHLDEYIRTYIPAFVTERTLPDNRENLREELAKVGLDYNDRFEYMCRTGGRCSKNEILVERL